MCQAMHLSVKHQSYDRGAPFDLHLFGAARSPLEGGWLRLSRQSAGNSQRCLRSDLKIPFMTDVLDEEPRCFARTPGFLLLVPLVPLVRRGLGPTTALLEQLLAVSD